MKILLIAPLDPKAPTKLKLLIGGENTYSQTLLKFHPPKIYFVHFTNALKKGEISYHWSYYLCLWLQKLRILPMGPRVYAFKINGNFDLIYAHADPIKIIGSKIPVVISNSSSDIVFSKYYQQLPLWRISIYQNIKKIIFKILGIIDGEVNQQNTKIFVFSKWAKKIKNQLQIKDCQVIYPGLHINVLKRKINKSKSVKILFAGVWFERKGGRILLKAFRKLSRKFPDIKLKILGELPADIHILPDENISQHNFVSYTQLKKYYSNHDILVHAPIKVEGYGMVVPEAMAHRMTIIVSKVCALEEFIIHNQSGLVVKPNSAIALELALKKLIKKPKLRYKMGNLAYLRFQQMFSIRVFNKQLSAFFRDALKNQN